MSDPVIPDPQTMFSTPEGGTVGTPSPVPERTSENFVCLRGPCRHYWHVVTMSHSGNPADTWKHLGIEEPRQHHHICVFGPQETDFAEDNAFECNRWDPMHPDELVQLGKRREAYFEREPDDEQTQP